MQYRDLQIAGSPVSTDTSISEFPHLWLRKYYRKECKNHNTRECAVKHSLLEMAA